MGDHIREQTTIRRTVGNGDMSDEHIVQTCADKVMPSTVDLWTIIENI